MMNLAFKFRLYPNKKQREYFKDNFDACRSSQLCHCCHAKNPLVKNLSIRTWTCPNCSAVHDRDVNAAINILDEGLRLVNAGLLA